MPVKRWAFSSIRCRCDCGSASRRWAKASGPLTQLLAALLRHEHAPLALAQRCSGVAAPAPLFSALLNYRHVAAASAVPEAATEGIEVLGGEERTNYPFSLSVEDFGIGFGLTAQIAAAVDASRVCALMHAALAHIVDALERDPAMPVCRVNVLPEAERRQLLLEWNATETAFPSDRSIQDLFFEQAEKTPDALAVLDDGVGTTYAQLDARAGALARRLRGIGVGPSSRVAVLLERSTALVVAELAVLECGAAYVPLDRRAPAERLHFILEDCGVRVLLSARTESFAPSAGIERVNVDDAGGSEPEARGVAPATAASGSDAAAYIMYTSGSTGRPKGVEVSHRSVARSVVDNGYAAFEAGDRIAFAGNPAFDVTTLEVWAPLLHGGCIVVIDEATLFDPARFVARIRDWSIDVLFVPAGLFAQYVDELASVFCNLRYVVVGGDVFDPAVAARALRYGGPRHLLNGYGPTEATSLALVHEITSVPSGAIAVPIGRPIGNTRAYVVDAHLQPVPIGACGELYIGGAGVARGYVNRPELTAQRFVPSPFVDGDRLYKTGDLARWLPGGTLEFAGRNDFQVKIRGFRIELGEIEAQLAEHPQVRDAVVVALDDTAAGKRLVAYYTPAGDAEAAVESLRAHLLAALPEYMVPAAYVRLDALPLDPNGKLDRRALPAPADGGYAARAYEAPEGEAESAIAALWCELLDLERVGRHDNFFELGGHSLLAVRAIERMHRLGLHTDVRTLFTTPTPAQLALAAGSESGVVAVAPNGIAAGCTAITPEMLPLVRLNEAEIALDRCDGAWWRGQRRGYLSARSAPGRHSVPPFAGARWRSVRAARHVSLRRPRAARSVRRGIAVRDRSSRHPAHVVQASGRAFGTGPSGVAASPLLVEEGVDAGTNGSTCGRPRCCAPSLRGSRWTSLGDGVVDASFGQRSRQLGDALQRELYAQGLASDKKARLPARCRSGKYVAQARLGVSREDGERFFREPARRRRRNDRTIRRD